MHEIMIVIKFILPSLNTELLISFDRRATINAILALDSIRESGYEWIIGCIRLNDR